MLLEDIIVRYTEAERELCRYNEKAARLKAVALTASAPRLSGEPKGTAFDSSYDKYIIALEGYERKIGKFRAAMKRYSDKIDRSLTAVSPMACAVVQMRVYEKKTFADVAEALGISKGRAAGIYYKTVRQQPIFRL